MDSLSDQNLDLDLITAAIHRLMEERKSGRDGDRPFIGPESDDEHLLLSKLLSQLESLKGGPATDPPTGIGSSPVTKETSSMAGVVTENLVEKPEETRSVETEEIVKELKEVRKQNRITHWLLSIMIVLTVTWQVSEVSLLLKMKDGLSHPFRLVGSILIGMLKGRGRDGEEESLVQNPSEMLPIPPVKIPELPKFEVTDLSLNGEWKHR